MLAALPSLTPPTGPPDVWPLIGFVAVTTVAYVAIRIRWPSRPCRRCHGTGALPSRLRRYRTCRRCHGKGWRPTLTSLIAAQLRAATTNQTTRRTRTRGRR